MKINYLLQHRLCIINHATIKLKFNMERMFWFLCLFVCLNSEILYSIWIGNIHDGVWVYYFTPFLYLICTPTQHIEVSLTTIWESTKFSYGKFNGNIISRHISYRQYCTFKIYLPVTCANSTISAPNTENAFTNSVKFATDSNLPKDFATWEIIIF